MVSSAPNSPGVPSASRSRSDTGANLLQELEALSQALYKASQAQNVISGGPAGPSPRKEQYQYVQHQLQQQQQQLPAPSAGQGLQRRETMPARGTVDVFGKQSSLVIGSVSNPAVQVPGRRTTQVRHSISARPSAPLYDEHEQEGQWKQPRHSRHSIAAPSRPLPPSMYGHPEEEEAVAAAAAPRGFERKLQPWHSQGFEKNLPPVSNFPEWLEDNINFSRKLEAAPEKKKSIWNWKPFRTLSHIGHTRYNCLFTLHVHAIEGLPQAMNGLRLTVHWRHKDRAVQTMPSRVFQGSAEFEETLQLRCSVYGSRSAHHAVKFMPKEFTLCVIALDVDELVLGQHRLDLSRLLPEAPDHDHDHDHEHEDDDKALSWTTSFKLAGKAKGGTLVVTFGYELLHREKGDKSGRFGSVIGSPAMSSPSLRAYGGGGSHSTHGTPRPRPADGNDFMSPALSEPGDYHDYMAMEHLNLDESPHSESSSGTFGENSSSKGSVEAVKFRHDKSRLEVNSRSGMSLNPHSPEPENYNNNDNNNDVFNYYQLAEPALAPLTPRQTEEPAADLKTERHQQQDYAADSSSAAHDDLGYEDSYEEDLEFIVVDQGVELGTLPEDIQYPEHRYDEGSVNNSNFQIQVNSPATTGLEKNFSLDWHAVVADKEENNSVVQLPEFHALEEIPRRSSSSSNTDVVRSVTEWEQEAAAQELEEDRSEDAVDDAAAKHWDPLGKFQRILSEEPAVQVEVMVVDDDHMDRLEEKERRYGNEERELSPRSEGGLSGVVVNHGGWGEFWDPLGKRENKISSGAEGEEREEQAAGVQQTPAPAIWKATPAPPLSFDHENSDEEIDSQAGVEMWSGSLNSSSSSSAQQPSTEIGAGNTYNNQAGIEDLDNEVDLIAGDFLSMLGMDGSERGGLIMGLSSDSENESPRALLLRQFEQEALLEGGVGVRLGDAEISEFNLDEMTERRGGVHHSDPAELSAIHSDGEARRWQSGEDEELASIMEAAESELQKATQTMRSKTRAKMLEDAETEALMQEWGLNERAFENSPPKPTAGFVDTIGNQMVKVPTEPPVLAQGVGPVVQTKDGGMLRSMTPALFSRSNAGGKLVMQVSKPVVVPSEMGSSGMDIFRRLASGGVENMALQAMVAMPLEDITGKSVHQISYESKAALEGPTYGQAYPPSNGYDAGPRVLDIGRRHSIGTAVSSRSMGASRSSTSPVDPSAEFVSLEQLAPMAMQKIEALAMDGLKIQSDMSDENAPFSVDALPWPDADAQEGNKFSRGAGVGSLDGVAAMHLLDSRSFSDDAPVEADGLMSKVISIDEWMRLDAGQYDENDTKDETLAILAAHGVVHKDVLARGSKEDRIRYLQGAKTSANFGKGGFMGNTLTIAMLVQLRDPLRNNEPVGAPMMALVQAERVIVPPRPKIPRRSPSLLGNSEVWFEEEETSGLRPEEDLPQPQFKVTAVHVSGLKLSEEQSKDTRNNKKKVWGNQKQQQSGSRWLAANGMGKSSSAGPKLSALKGRHHSEKDSTARPGESLWSISARVHGTGSKWKDVAVLNPHIRNPDVILANQKIRTR